MPGSGWFRRRLEDLVLILKSVVGLPPSREEARRARAALKDQDGRGPG